MPRSAYRCSCLWDGIGEGALEGDELRPANAELAGGASAAHAPGHVERLGAADQHFLRIAAAQHRFRRTAGDR
jgi:hypothetical protein